jgi:hypothetical protein
MSVLFGSVEYYERELLHTVEQNQVNTRADEQISKTYAKLKRELLHDFVCEEKIRTECLENLTKAFCRRFNSDMGVTVQ